MSAVGFIGTGHIAAPMARFLAARGREVVVSDRNAEVAARLAENSAIRIEPNQGVLDACETVVLCLRPQIAADVLDALQFQSDHKVVSVMAGVPRAELQQLCAPATEFTQTIPLGYLETGGCPLPAYPDADVLAYGFAASLLGDSARLNRFLAELRKGSPVEDGFEKAFGTKVKDRADSWLQGGRRVRRGR